MKDARVSDPKRLLSHGAYLAVAALLIAGCTHAGPAIEPQPAAAAPQVAAVQPLPAVESDYTIGPGDVLEISVWKDPALSRQVVVLPDGTISFPLVGSFTVGGKTVVQLNADLTEKISRFVPEPDLSVIVQQVNSLVVYVIGKVNRPGHIPLNHNISVIQALSMAGGFNIFADQQNIQIIRRHESGTVIISFDYKAVAEGGRVEDNIELQRGDVVVVK